MLQTKIIRYFFVENININFLKNLGLLEKKLNKIAKIINISFTI